MTSSIGWIDFSSEHRDRLRTVLDMLDTPGVLDELGIGPLRDAFANRMFPGISTIQTRAKYFPLTAHLLKKYTETKRTPNSPTLERYLEQSEKECRIQLVHKARGNETATTGIIGGSFGIDPRRDVVRKPSSIYWNGLRLFGCVKPNLSLAEFSRRLRDPKWHLRAVLKDRGEDRGDDLDAEDLTGHPRILAPEVPTDYLEQLSIDLIHTEADFLRSRIIATQPESLLGQILLTNSNMVEVTESKIANFVDFTALPLIQRLKDTELRRTVQHARDFWLILEGAHIRYNYLVQDRLGTAEARAKFEELWADWRERISSFPAQWDTAFMWKMATFYGGRIEPYTRSFVDGWIDAAREGARDLKLCDRLVTDQERFNKRMKARLSPKNSKTVGPDWIGIGALDYRQTQVRRLVRDIRDGLSRTEGRDA